MKKERKLIKGMTFDKYWSLNKMQLMTSKITTEELAKSIWDDIQLLNAWKD